MEHQRPAAESYLYVLHGLDHLGLESRPELLGNAGRDVGHDCLNVLGCLLAIRDDGGGFDNEVFDVRCPALGLYTFFLKATRC